MSFLKLGATALVFLTVTSFVWASESDELREKAEAMQREAAELAEHGHHKEAVDLKRKAIAMLEEAERLGRDRPDDRQAEMMELKRLLEMFRQQEKELAGIAGEGERLEDVRRKAERVEAELWALSRQPRHDHDAPHEDLARRLEHMRIAVDHLSQAGLHEIAEHVAHRSGGHRAGTA